LTALSLQGGPDEPTCSGTTPRSPTGTIVIDTRRPDDPGYGIRFRASGKRRFASLGRASEGWTHAKAERELADTLALVRKGLWQPPAEPVVETAIEEPTLHVLSSEWVERRRHEVDERTVEHWSWALSVHLLPFFADHRPSQVTAAVIEKWKTGKLAQREERLAAIERWRKADPAKRGRMPARPLSNSSINAVLKVLGQVLDEACELGYIETNVSRGKRRRLRASKPKRTWLELVEVRALLDAAEVHRALLATMILAGLRVSELCQLRWADVDLAAAKLRIVDSKTDAGQRVIDVIPLLLDELKAHRADARLAEPDALVFGTSRGTPRNRTNIRKRILLPAVARANLALAKQGRAPIPAATNHSLRRTFCALLFEAGATPPYVMGQMGHTDPALALEVYAKVMERKRDTGERMDALVRGADWAATGSNDVSTLVAAEVESTA
jgi:integrase